MKVEDAVRFDQRLTVEIPCVHALCSATHHRLFPDEDVLFDDVAWDIRLGDQVAALVFLQAGEVVAVVVLDEQVLRGRMRVHASVKVLYLDTLMLRQFDRVVAATSSPRLEYVQEAMTEFRKWRNKMPVNQLRFSSGYQTALLNAFEAVYSRYPLVSPSTVFLCESCDLEREELFGFAVSGSEYIQQNMRLDFIESSSVKREWAKYDLEGRRALSQLPFNGVLDAMLFQYAVDHRDVILSAFHELKLTQRVAVEQSCFVKVTCSQCKTVFLGVFADDEVFFPDVLKGRLVPSRSPLPPLAKSLPPRQAWKNVCPQCSSLDCAEDVSTLVGGRILCLILDACEGFSFAVMDADDEALVTS